MPAQAPATEVPPAPIPMWQDPTALTNQAVRTAIDALREVIESKLDGLKMSADEKFFAFRDLHNLLEQRVIGFGVELDKMFARTNELSTMRKGEMDRELVGVRERFELLEKQTVKAAADVKSAVDAAFAAAKDGVTQQNQSNTIASQKQENAFRTQLDQLTTNVTQIAKASDDKLYDLKKTTDDKIGDLKDRIVAMEGRSSISDPTTAAALRDMANSITALKSTTDVGAGRRVQGSESNAFIIAMIMMAATVGGAIVGLITFLERTAH